MNTATLNQNPAHNLEFTHNLDSHEYVQPKYGYKGFFTALGLTLSFFPMSIIIILSDRNSHEPIDIDTIAFFFLSIAFGFGALYYFPFCQQTRPSKAILWLPDKENNPQACLHIRSKNWHLFLGIILLFFFFLTFLCAAYSLGSIPPSQALQPWEWIRITPINIKADLMCLAADTILIFFILLILCFPQDHILYTPQTLHIYRKYIFLHLTTTNIYRPWEQLTHVNLIQPNTNNPGTNYLRSTITLKDGQEKTFRLPHTILADPCWMTFIANALINLPDTPSRQDFLTNLHLYAPPKAKIRHTKP